MNEILCGRWCEMAELKPCPFCGGSAHIKHQSGPYYTFCVRVICKECGAASSPYFYGNNGTIKAEDCSYAGREDAIERVAKRWNRREDKNNPLTLDELHEIAGKKVQEK